jgi:phosphoribosylanthranilate isomerase
MGVDMLGFRAIEGQENYIPPALFQEIRGWVTGPKIVAELNGLSENTDLRALLENYAPDLVELTFTEYRKFKSHFSLPCLVSLSDEDIPEISGEHENVVYWIIQDEALKNNDNMKLKDVLLRINSPQGIFDSIKSYNAKGIVLDGSQEIRPGFKDYSQLSDILEVLEE